MADEALPSSAETASAERFALTLAGSLILHFALIFGLQIRAVPMASTSTHIIQARLVAAPSPAAAPQPPAAQAPENKPLAAEPRPAPPAQPQPPSTPQPPPTPSPPPVPEQAAGAEAPKNPAGLPSIDIPLIEDPTFYPAREVDVHPTALQAILPAYPEEAASANTSGSVVLQLLLDESGKVQDLSVEEANPPGLFDQSALDAFRNARFTPAQRHGRAVKSLVRIKVNYDLADRIMPIDKTKQK